MYLVLIKIIFIVVYKYYKNIKLEKLLTPITRTDLDCILNNFS